MARKRTLLTRLADTPTPVATGEPDTTSTDTPTPPAGAPPPDSKLETPPPAAPKRISVDPIAEVLPKIPAVVTDPQLVWTNLIRTPHGRSLTDPRIQQLSPQRFDTVFLSALKSAFLAGWDASKEGGVK